MKRCSNIRAFTSKKYFRFINLCILFVIFDISLVMASPSYSQTTLLSVDATNKTLGSIFREIEENSEYIFLYNDKALDLSREVNISDIQNTTIDVLLNKILTEETGYQIVDRQVLLFPKEVEKNSETGTKAIAQQSNNEVTGVVTDAKGETLIGVSIVEKGTSNGAVTNVSGAYKLTVSSPNATLVFSYIGYATQEQKLQGKTNLNVTLEEAPSVLDEVVVVAYGTQRKSSITGSISSLKTDDLKGVTSPGVANMLQGKVAGVHVNPSSGQPGGGEKGTNIRIRGTGSITGNKDPLWVVDGVVGGTSSDLNPNDIESISILKDGTATALYGSRGANGVVLITTKKGGAAGTSKINVSARMGVATLQKGKLRIMNGSEHYDYTQTAFENAGTTPSWFTPQLAEQNTDWWDIATKNALTQNYNVNYTTGTDKLRSYLSGDYYDEDGTIRGFNFKRFTLRVNTDYEVNKKLTIKTKIASSFRKTKDQQYSLGYYTLLPWDSPWDSKGNLKTGNEGQPSKDIAADADPKDYWYSRINSNYLHSRKLNWGKKSFNATDIGLGFDYKIFDFLTFESNNKFGFKNEYYDTYTDPNSLSGKSTHGKIVYETRYTKNTYASQMLRFYKIFNDKHEVNAFAGYDYDDVMYQWARSTVTNIVTGAEVVGAGAEGHKVEGNKEIEKNVAMFFNGNYAFDSKYMFQASVRRDASSRFGADNRWATFWALGAAWNMHKEKFIQNLEFVNELKLRTSYGTTGNVPPFRYGSFTLYQIDQEYGGDPAFLSNYAGNPKLTWEETKSFDLGLDIRLFDRLNLTVDMYSKKVDGLLYLRRLSAITGFNNQNANDGNLENKGYELTISPEIIKTADWDWDVSFNVGYNKNKITYIPKENFEGNYALAMGYSYNYWYMKEWAGVDSQTGRPLWFKVDKETGEKTATTIYNDATNVMIDQSLPKYTGGFSTNLRYKDFFLNANFMFVTGAKIYNEGRAGSFDRDGEDITQPGMKLKSNWSRWEKPGDIATHPRIIEGGNNSSSAKSSRYLENGDFLKMKSLSLSYNIPVKVLRPMGISTATLMVGGENLFTITNFSGMDPEVYLSTEHNGVANTSGYPTVRRFTFGLNLTF